MLNQSSSFRVSLTFPSYCLSTLSLLKHWMRLFSDIPFSTLRLDLPKRIHGLPSHSWNLTINIYCRKENRRKQLHLDKHFFIRSCLPLRLIQIPKRIIYKLISVSWVHSFSLKIIHFLSRLLNTQFSLPLWWRVDKHLDLSGSSGHHSLVLMHVK